MPHRYHRRYQRHRRESELRSSSSLLFGVSSFSLSMRYATNNTQLALCLAAGALSLDILQRPVNRISHLLLIQHPTHRRPQESLLPLQRPPQQQPELPSEQLANLPHAHNSHLAARVQCRPTVQGSARPFSTVAMSILSVMSFAYVFQGPLTGLNGLPVATNALPFCPAEQVFGYCLVQPC